MQRNMHYTVSILDRPLEQSQGMLCKQLANATQVVKINS